MPEGFLARATSLAPKKYFRAAGGILPPPMRLRKRTIPLRASVPCWPETRVSRRAGLRPKMPPELPTSNSLSSSRARFPVMRGHRVSNPASSRTVLSHARGGASLGWRARSFLATSGDHASTRASSNFRMAREN